MVLPASSYAWRPIGGLHNRAAPTEILPTELAETNHVVVAKGSLDSALGYKILTRRTAPRLALRMGLDYDGASQLGPYLLIPALTRLNGLRNWTIEFGVRHELDPLLLGTTLGTSAFAGLAKWGPRNTNAGLIHVLHTTAGTAIVRVPAIGEVVLPAVEPHGTRWISIVSDDAANLLRVFNDGLQIGTVAGDVLAGEDAFILGICPNNEGARDTDHATGFAVEEFRAWNTNLLGGAGSVLEKWAGKKLSLEDAHPNRANLVSLVRMDEAGARFCRDLVRPSLPATFGPTGGVVAVTGSPEAEPNEDGLALCTDGLWSCLQADLSSREFRTEWTANWNLGGPGATNTDIGFDVGFTLLEERTGTLLHGIRDGVGTRVTITFAVLGGGIGLVATIVNGATTVTVTGVTPVTVGQRHVVGLRKTTASLILNLDGNLDALQASVNGAVAGVSPDYLRVGAGFLTATDKDSGLLNPVPVLIDTVKIYERSQTNAELARFGRAWKETEWEEPGQPRLASFTKGSTSVTVGSAFGNVVTAGHQGMLVRLEQEFTSPSEQTLKTTPIGFGIIASIAGTTATLASAWSGRTGASTRWAVPVLLSYWRAPDLDIDFGSGPPSVTEASVSTISGEKTAFPVLWQVATSPGARVFGSPDSALPLWAIGFLREDRDNPGTGMRFFRAPSNGRSYWLAFGGFGVAEFDDRRRLFEGRRYMTFRHPQDGVALATSVNGTTFQIDAYLVPDAIDGVRPIVSFLGFRFEILNGRLHAINGADEVVSAKTVPRGRRIHVRCSGTWGGIVRVFQEGELVGTFTPFIFPGAHTAVRVGRRSTTGRGVSEFGGLIEAVRIDDAVGDTTDFVPPATLTATGATALVDCGLGEEFLLTESVASVAADVLSPPLLEVVPRIGPSKREQKPSFATIFERAIVTTSIGPPSMFDGTNAGRDGVFPPTSPPTLALSRLPWWSTDFRPNLGDHAKGGSLVFYGENWITYSPSNLPQDEFPDQATFNYKLPTVMFGRTSTPGGANSGTSIVIDGFIKVDTDAPRERMPIVLRRADETDEGNFSLWAIPILDGGGLPRWGLRFAFFDSKERLPRGFEQQSNNAANLAFPVNAWIYFAVGYHFGDPTTATMSIDHDSNNVASLLPGAQIVTPTGFIALGNNDTPAKPEFNGALEIGGGSYLLERSKPIGFVGKVAEIRISTALQGHAEATIAGAATPTIPLDHTFGGVIGNAGSGNPTRARVVFSNDEGRGYRVHNTLHFRNPSGVAANGDAQYTADPKAEFQPFGELQSKRGPPHIDGKIEVVTTFFDPLFVQESNPSPIATIETSETSGQEDAFAVTELVVSGLPIPAERPMERRVYRTLPGGGSFFLDEEVKEGSSGEVRLIRSNASLAARQALVIDNNPAPDCRALTATESRVVYGGLIDEGPGLVAWSKAFVSGAVPFAQRQAVGSPLGGDVTALAVWGGRLLIFKDDNAQVGTFGDDVSLSLAPMEEPYGAAGPMAIAGADHLLVYVTRKGIYAWTGASQRYAGLRIEGTFAGNADAAEAVAFYDPAQTIWCALLRSTGSTRFDTFVRMDASEGQIIQVQGAQVLVARGMTVSRGFPLESAGLGVGLDGRFRLLGMTSKGSVVAIETGKAAGNGAFDPTGTLTFSATSTNGQTPAQNAVTGTGGTFPAFGHGLRGAAGLHSRAGVLTPIVVWRASGTLLEYDGPAPLAGDTFLVGAYEKLGVGPVSALGDESHAKRMIYVMVHSTPGGLSGDTTVEIASDSGPFLPVTAKPQSNLPANTTKPWQLLVSDRVPNAIYHQYRVRAVFGAFSLRMIVPRVEFVEPRP